MIYIQRLYTAEFKVLIGRTVSESRDKLRQHNLIRFNPGELVIRRFAPPGTNDTEENRINVWGVIIGCDKVDPRDDYDPDPPYYVMWSSANLTRRSL